MIIAHLSVTGLPSDGASVGRYVRRAVEVIEAAGLRYEVHAMGTEIESDSLDEVFRVVRRIHAALFKMGAQRVSTQLKIDDRRDKRMRMADKVRSARGRKR